MCIIPENFELINRSLKNSMALYIYIGPLGTNTERGRAPEITVDQPAKFHYTLYITI
jgi:hypothetical protein